MKRENLFEKVKKRKFSTLSSRQRIYAQITFVERDLVFSFQV